MASPDEQTPGPQPLERPKPRVNAVVLVVGIILVIFAVLVAFVVNRGITSDPEGGTLNRSQAEQDNPKPR
jgi:hypothetical protein